LIKSKNTLSSKMKRKHLNFNKTKKPTYQKKKKTKKPNSYKISIKIQAGLVTLPRPTSTPVLPLCFLSLLYNFQVVSQISFLLRLAGPQNRNS